MKGDHFYLYEDRSQRQILQKIKYGLTGTAIAKPNQAHDR